jgi:hypothetical protein
MYCSACGTQLQPGLIFCSRCGKRVADEGAARSKFRQSPIAAAGNTAGVGFVAFIFVMLVLVKNGVVGNDLIPVTFFYFAALFGLCFMLLKYGRQETEIKKEMPAAEPQYLKPVTTAQLPEPAERPASVTEHTTRTLDHVPIERN